MTPSRDKSPLLSDVAIVLLFICLLLAPILDYAFGGLFSYADEAATILLVAWALLSKQTNKIGVHEGRALVCLVLICVFGLIGNVAHGYQGSLFAVAIDLFTCLKIFISYLAARIVLRGRESCLRAFQFVGKAFFVAALVGFLFHVTGIMRMGTGRVMFGIPCYQFLFSHPTNLAAYCAGFIALMFVDTKPSRFWVLAACILLIASQRIKAVAFAFIVIFFLFYGMTKRDDRKPPKLVFLFLGFGTVFLAMDQIQLYFLDSISARALLMQVGLDIALKLFPLGSGFATFATNMSGVYYSPLYYKYGLNTVWGLTPTAPSFVSDSFWPAVISEFGILGLLASVILLIELFESISIDAKQRNVRFAAYGLIPIYLLILSTADASFFNFYGPFYALVMASITNKAKAEQLGGICAPACSQVWPGGGRRGARES